MTERVEVLVVVEDEPDMRMTLRFMLETDPRISIAGEAEDAATAIELARSSNPGLIILDHSIQGEMMGLQAAPLLREAAPQAKILLFTAFDLKSEAAAEPAIDEYLNKTDIGVLLPTVQRMLGLPA